MAEFFFQYGLFTLKSVTFVVLMLLGFAGILALLASKSQHKKEASLEIEKLNDKFEDFRDDLEAEIFSKDELKKLHKARRKEDRAKAKEEKRKKKEKKEKDKEEVAEKGKLYVLRFDGDIEASETDIIRWIISALLEVITAKDEVLVVLESGGGVVHGYGLAAAQLLRLKEKGVKLTIAVDLVAASGGYMMAVVADHIIAAPFAVVGSIGVLAQLPNFNRLLEKNSIDIEHHTAGEYKTTLTMLGKNTDKGREKFRQELDDTHKLFKGFVAKYRPKLDVTKIANGDHWYGSDAIDLGLVDELKTSDTYIQEACKEHDVFEVSYETHESLKERIQSYISYAARKLCSKAITKLQSYNWVQP